MSLICSQIKSNQIKQHSRPHTLKLAKSKRALKAKLSQNKNDACKQYNNILYIKKYIFFKNETHTHTHKQHSKYMYQKLMQKSERSCIFNSKHTKILSKVQNNASAPTQISIHFS